MSIELTEKTKAADAICGAYLMVTHADGKHIALEEGRLLATLIDQPAFNKLSTNEIENAYNQLNADFAESYPATAARVLGAIAYFSDVSDIKETIKAAAQSAIVADQEIKIQEESAIDAIAAALGLKKGTL